MRDIQPQLPSLNCLTGILLSGAFILYLCFAVRSATTNAPVRPEPALLAAGVHHLTKNDFHLYAVNPPLVRMIAAIPVILAKPNFDWSGFNNRIKRRSEFSVGQSFARVNRGNFRQFLISARLVGTAFGLLGLIYCFLWSIRIWSNPLAGCCSAWLWSMSPTLVGHGSLITNDVPTATMLLIATYHWSLWRDKATWTSAGTAGLAIGLAFSTKFLCLVLAVFLIVDLYDIFKSDEWYRKAFRTILIWLLAIYTVHFTYLFKSPQTPEIETEFASTLFQRAFTGDFNSCPVMLAGAIPVPLPTYYLRGLDAQISDVENNTRSPYLLGAYRESGWYSFYFIWITCKCSILMIVAFVFALHAAFRCPSLLHWRNTLTLVAPFTLLLMVLSINTRMNEHGRYCIPVIAVMVVISGGIYVVICSDTRGRQFQLARYLLLSLMVIFCVNPLKACLSGRTISFFNLPTQLVFTEYPPFLDSSYDWGQDLYRLEEWLREMYPSQTVCVQYDALILPSAIGSSLKTCSGILSSNQLQVKYHEDILAISHREFIDLSTNTPSSLVGIDLSDRTLITHSETVFVIFVRDEVDLISGE